MEHNMTPLQALETLSKHLNDAVFTGTIAESVGRFQQINAAIKLLETTLTPKPQENKNGTD